MPQYYDLVRNADSNVGLPKLVLRSIVRLAKSIPFVGRMLVGLKH